VIALEGASARVGSSWIANVTVACGAGLHAIVGARDDGGPLLLAAVAGAARVRRGRIRVLGRPPSDAKVRRAIARIPMDPALPAALRVAEFLGVAARIRGEAPRPAEERLGALGIEALAERAIRSLSPSEARAVALLEAVTSSRVRVLLVEEPRAIMDPRAAAYVGAALQNKARGGCAVLIATASLRDASDLADDHTMMRSGSVVAQLRSLDDVVGFSPEGARLRVLLRTVTDARSMVAALAHDTSIEGVAREDAVVLLRGPDAVWLGRAAATAALQAGVDVVEMGLGAPALEEARAAAAGIAAATYEAAYRRTRAAAAPEPRAAPPEGAP
jgi:ABC-type multidrug transport system ATPase subunit